MTERRSRSSADHSQAPASISTVRTTAATVAGSRSATANSPAARTIAVMMRLRRASLTFRGLSSRWRRRGRRLSGSQPEAPLAAGEEGECGLELGQIEIRPQRRTEIQLGVGAVPQQEIADALLAARADHEIRIRHSRKLQRVGEAGFVYVL